jgi:phosphoglycolate phosphatase-like HAD superfamily hydrolase
LTHRLVLFDIDGTLLSAGGISARALAEALGEVFGTSGPMAGYDFSGKTDPLIVRELMTAAGFSNEEIGRRMADTLALYRGRLAASLRPEHVTPKPGVGDLLEVLAREPSVTLALLTGNLEPCARLKLAPLGVNDRFGFGAFGSDHEDRHRLPAVAVERAFVATGRRFEGKGIVVVGDSIHDVRCGRSLGVRAVAVASGKTSPETLAGESPDALLADFSDTGASLEAILG